MEELKKLWEENGKSGVTLFYKLGNLKREVMIKSIDKKLKMENYIDRVDRIFKDYYMEFDFSEIFINTKEEFVEFVDSIMGELVANKLVNVNEG